MTINATEDQDEPLGEAPELTMPRVASLVDRQAQALNEIRDAHRRYSEALERREHGGVAANRLAYEVGQILERQALA